MQRNVAGQHLSCFVFVASTGLPASGDAANLSASVAIDDGTVTALGTNTATEQSASLAPGYYTFPLAQAETNGAKLGFFPKSSTSGNVAIAVPAVVFTVPANDSLLSIDTSGRVLLQPTQTGVTIPTVGTVTGGTTSSSLATLQSTANTINANTTSCGSPMQAYTQPTGFLAATFPATVASPTNITAGTITTVANLTNAPGAGDFTTAMKASLNAATPTVTIGTIADKTGYSLSAAGVDAIMVEDGINARQALSLIGATTAGKASGLDVNAPVFTGMGNSTPRIAASTDNAGNRVVVNITPPA